MNCWPTIPVAPSTPTSIRLRIVLAPGLAGPENTKPAGGFRRVGGFGCPL